MNKILIIEDDLEINALLADFLKEKGYAVHCQYDGLHVLDFLNKEKIDLIILDIMLPYRSGDIILSDVRKKSTIPVIIISAKETTQNKIDLLRLGADDYITKPFDIEEVLARIESNLRRVQFQNSQTECLQYNNLTLDLEKNTAFLNGIELSLTAKEFGILELLMKYPDKVFSKSNLFQSVWDTEYIAEDNTNTQTNSHFLPHKFQFLLTCQRFIHQHTNRHSQRLGTHITCHIKDQRLEAHNDRKCSHHLLKNSYH